MTMRHRPRRFGTPRSPAAPPRRTRLSGLRPLGLVVAAAASLARGAPGPAQPPPPPPTPPPATARPNVVVPDFWDPRQRIERPAAGVVPAIRFLTTDAFPPFNFLDD